jgi:hypothetical protein
VNAETRATAREQLRAYLATPPKRRRRYRRPIVVWVPLLVVLPLVAIAMPFIMIGWAARIFGKVFLDPRTIAFAGLVVAVCAEVAIRLYQQAVTLAQQAEEAWEHHEHPGEHERHHDPLERHFTGRGRW